MIRDLICSLDYSIVAEVALTVFVIAFLAIFYGTARLTKGATERFAAIPLSDDLEDPIQ